MATPVTVSGLFVYPVKSTRGTAQTRVRVTPTGFEWDRQWMLVDARGLFLSQRTHPQLARIVPAITPEALVLSAPGLPPLTVPFDQSGERIAVRVQRDSGLGIDQGTAAHAWVSAVAGQDARLVRVAPDMNRPADRKFVGGLTAPLTFVDGFPFLICNQASFEDLNQRLPEPITLERFRPNIVVTGLPAWAEDRIDTLQTGAVTLRLVKPCTRCTIPSVDPNTGERSIDPVAVLRPFRFRRELLGVTFGENAVILDGIGRDIERGAAVRVTYDDA